MKILHYSLGFPPYRSGGMTKYCVDLMKNEKAIGHDVSLLWPGSWISNSIKCKIQIREVDPSCGINSYELINALPVPLLDGIKNVDLFTDKKDINVFLSFISKEKFEVLHIHTLMGLPIEAIEAAKRLGIRTIYTTHDYFGICPRTGLMRGNDCCTDDYQCSGCEVCCRNALSINKIRILQSPVYKKLKRSKLFEFLRNRHINTINTNDDCSINEIRQFGYEGSREYLKLRKYYIDELLLIDTLHFNSTNTKKVFEKYIKHPNPKVISISNSSVVNKRKKHFYKDKVIFGFLSSISRRKGYFLLKEIFDEIYESGITNFEFHIYTPYDLKTPYMVSYPPYQSNEIEMVMAGFDVLLAPSLWYETFGFTVLEALANGVPVLVSDNVGAKDLIVHGKNGFICSTEKKALKQQLVYIIQNPDIIKEMNEYIYRNVEIKTMKKHTAEMLELYKTNKGSAE